MTNFWIGVGVASVFWIGIYAIAVAAWAIWDMRRQAAEMGNTEAANDRPTGQYGVQMPYGGAMKRPDPFAPTIDELLAKTPSPARNPIAGL